MDIDLGPTNNINTEFPSIQQAKKVELPMTVPKPFIQNERVSKIRTNEPVRHDPGHAAFFITCEIELNTKNSTRRQQSCLLVEFLVFNSAFGRHRH